MGAMILRPENPYVRAMLAHPVLAERYAATLALLRNDPGPYIAWWRALPEMQGRTMDEARAKADYYGRLTREIAEHGYSDAVCAERSKTDGRGESGPIRVNIGARGQLLCCDGNHRLLAALAGGHAVTVTIRYIEAEWHRRIAWIGPGATKPYQPLVHPHLEGIRPMRQGLGRYEAIHQWCHEHNVKSAMEWGCAEGTGLSLLAETDMRCDGVEADAGRHALAESLAGTMPRMQTMCADHIRRTPTEALVLLSILQHVWTTWEQAAEAARMLRPKVAFVELPEAGSVTWHVAMRAPDAGERMLDLLAAEGRYRHRECIYADPQYRGRQTWAMWR
jgi:hypothetical protein